MRSDSVKTGTAQAPHRSLFNALGFTEEERRRPMIGIVSSFNEIVPGHMNLDKITEAVKMGVAMAGGMPVVFPAIAVCDGIAMGHVGMKYSLVTRDLIADSTECMAMAHGFDGLVCIPNCDKNVPGLLMAAARVNIPTIFVSGGPMLAGHVHGQKRSLSSMFEAVGSVAAGTMTMDELAEFEEKVCPTCGSCSGMYTANSMNCLTEAIGMGLRGNGTIPAVYSERIRLAKHAGMKIMELVEKNIRPRDIMTPEAFQNALTVDMALGCSTNTMLHLPAIAREAGSRTKMAVWSKNPNVDPVGSCVGVNGSRVNAVVSELNGEKIDIINWSKNPANLIENALSPAKVVYVAADAEEKTAQVIVPDYQLSLAIGREGQNARLAARLTGFKIDIKSESQARDLGLLDEVESYADETTESDDAE